MVFYSSHAPWIQHSYTLNNTEQVSGMLFIYIFISVPVEESTIWLEEMTGFWKACGNQPIWEQALIGTVQGRRVINVLRKL